MKKKVLACVILAVAVLFTTVISPAFCNLSMSYQSTVTLTTVQSSTPTTDTEAQMKHIAELLAGYSTSKEYTFKLKYVSHSVNAQTFFLGSSSSLYTRIINAIIDYLYDWQVYRNQGSITSSDTLCFGPEYMKALAQDGAAGAYYGNYTWSMKVRNGKFFIVVDQIDAPNAHYECYSDAPNGGTLTTSGPQDLPSDSINMDSGFSKL